MKLLLENGGDPRTEDNEGTTAFDLAKDDEIRRILHEAMIKKDTKEEASGLCRTLNERTYDAKSMK